MPNPSQQTPVDQVAEKQPLLAEVGLIAKAKNLEALRDAVVDAASISAGLWFSYLFMLFYLAIAVGSVTHRDLFFENPVKLPFFNVELPLVAFFGIAPLLLVIVHVYVLLHFLQFADKLGAFHAQLKIQITDGDVQARLRRQLPSNIFVQLLAGPDEIRTGVKGILLWLIAHVSLVVAPLAILVLFQVKFLPYHSAITWWQRLAIFSDLVLLWMLWPSVARGAATWITPRDILRSAKFAALALVRLLRKPSHSDARGETSVAVLALASLILTLLVFTVATYPGELSHRLPSFPFIPWWNDGKGFPVRLATPHELLFADGVNFAERRPTGLLSNRLVLPGLNVPESISLRARHLEGAVLIGATLVKADFTAAILTDARLDDADLREATFDCAEQADFPQVCARLNGASFNRASLQGASFVDAQLQKAQFKQAKLQGASLDHAQMQGANLDSASLQGALLARAQLQAAVLSSAQMQGAVLTYAQLQGANLDGANLQNASLLSVFAWRADARTAWNGKARISGPRLDPKEECEPSKENDNQVGLSCDWSPRSLARIRLILKQDASRLDPAIPVQDESEISKKWSEFENDSGSLSSVDYEKGLIDELRKTGCASVGAPYVVRGLLRRIDSLLEIDGSKSTLAAAFLDGECLGALGVTEADKAKLTEIRGRRAQSQ